MKPKPPWPRGQTIDFLATVSSLVPQREGQTKLLYLSKTHQGGINTRNKYKSLLSPKTLRIRTLPTEDKDLDFHSNKELSHLDRRSSQLSLSTGTVPNTTPRIFNFVTHVRPSGWSVRSFQAPSHMASVFEMFNLAPVPNSYNLILRINN